MNPMREISSFIIAGLMAVQASALAADSVRAGPVAPEAFRSPPPSARAQVWWHWINGNVNRAGITADLEAMARVGIGGATIFNVSGPRGPIVFNSPEWHALVKHAMAEAQRVGVELHMLNDAGWSGSGGPWIPPELSMQKVVWSEQVVEGGRTVRLTLPRPETRNEYSPTASDYYRDIAVLAFPARDGDGVKLADLAPKFTTSGTRGKKGGFTLAGISKKAPQYIQIELAQPCAARQLSARIACRGAVQGTLEVSEDGQHFKPVTSFTARPPVLALDFDRVSGRFYRLTLDHTEKAPSKVEVTDLELTARYSVEDIRSKTLEKAKSFLAPRAAWPAAPEGVAIPREAIVNLSAKMDAAGALAWEAPAGRWTLVRLGCTTTGKENHPSPYGGGGLECDKLSQEAIRFHFDHLAAKVIAENKDLVGRDKTFAGLLIESWEVGSQNWTPKMGVEFQRLRGYDPAPYLLAYCGRVIESREVTERFLWDLRRSIGDLIAENYAAELRRLAHAHGMDLTIEGCGAPADESYYGGQADIPMGECWSWDQGRRERPNVLSGSSMAMTSVGHTHGRPIIATEAFTAHIGEAWQEHPGNMKALGDVAFCGGINRFIFHRYAMQPFPAARPGMTMGAWGVHYERTQTWWEQSKAWHEYLARCQYMLQQGLFVADVLYLQPEGSPRPIWKPSGIDSPPNVRGGFNYDVCNADVVLNGLVAKDGRLVLPDGMSYRMLVVPGGETMTPRLVRKLKELADGGATLLVNAKPPVASPSLADKGAGDAEVQKTAAELWPRLVAGKTPGAVLAERGVKPDFIAAPILRYIHRTVGETEVYFVANPEAHSVDARAAFRVTGRRPALWWPETGSVTPVLAFEEKDGMTTLPLHLEQLGSVFVVFQPGAAAPAPLRALVLNGQSLVPELGAAIPLPSPEQGGAPRINHEAAIEPPPACDISRGLLWRNGAYVMETASGQKQELTVALPAAQQLTGPWHVTFDPQWGPFKAEAGRPAGEFLFATLEDWSKRPEEAIKYYSGTASYRTQFDWQPAGAPTRFYLDLGKVAVMAEVRLNGRDLGILWKPPFRVDVTAALKPGKNELELKVVNLWVNRMIGDKQIPSEPEPVLGKDQKRKWPAWLLEGKPDPSGRYTFSTSQPWQKNDRLAESGLLGPVHLYPAYRLTERP